MFNKACYNGFDMKSCIIPDLEDLIKKNTDKEQEAKTSSRSTKTVAVFDLVGSTALKLQLGHDEAMKIIKKHNSLCGFFVRHFHGTVIKELGDGILAKFDDGENACICAINFREHLKKLSIKTKVAVSTGKIEQIVYSNNEDIYGSPVDSCAKMEKFCYPNQILIDSATHDVVKSFLMGYDDMEISKGMAVVIPGDSTKKYLFEISDKNAGLKNSLNIPLHFNENGRLHIDEKVSFIENSKIEVIEMGIRLREFTSYFDSRNPDEFKKPVLNLLKIGVNLKCFAINSKWAFDNISFHGDEKQYYEGIPDTLSKLYSFKKEVQSLGYAGKVEIFTYEAYPLFHVQCTDGETDAGKMTVSNYLYDIKRSECPVFQFSRQSHPIMFDTYWKSIKNLISKSKPWAP